jgi:predicted HD phosphohydrolase
MNAEEAEAFEADPMFDIYIKMRTWDDLAKITNKALPDLNRYKQMAISHLMQNN